MLKCVILLDIQEIFHLILQTRLQIVIMRETGALWLREIGAKIGFVEDEWRFFHIG